ncbi:hypothetical protein [Kitasatospora sp. NPDC056184]|uniref:hypothetical protein n=1 Tax=Kitasatospora sp. NPDC056184 TaxID=3345738 RepID=UPI0035E2104E
MPEDGARYFTGRLAHCTRPIAAELVPDASQLAALDGPFEPREAGRRAAGRP